MPFSGSSSSGTNEPIFKKFCTVDYVGDPTPHAKIWISQNKALRVLRELGWTTKHLAKSKISSSEVPESGKLRLFECLQLETQ